MAINFPTAPTLDQTYTYNGKTWKWNGYAWSYQDVPAFTVFTASPTAPLNPNPGDRWLKTDEGVLFTWYVDLDSGQWVDLDGGGLITTDGDSGSAPMYISDTQPAGDGTYMWVQTGLGDDQTGFSVWINTP